MIFDEVFKKTFLSAAVVFASTGAIVGCAEIPKESVHRPNYADFQPETSILKGVAQGLMGNPNWRNAASQGILRFVTIYDKDGKQAIAVMPENSDVPVRVFDPNGKRDISYEEYVNRLFKLPKGSLSTIP